MKLALMASVSLAKNKIKIQEAQCKYQNKPKNDKQMRNLGKAVHGAILNKIIMIINVTNLELSVGSSTGTKLSMLTFHDNSTHSICFSHRSAT